VYKGCSKRTIMHSCLFHFYFIKVSSVAAVPLLNACAQPSAPMLWEGSLRTSQSQYCSLLSKQHVIVYDSCVRSRLLSPAPRLSRSRGCSGMLLLSSFAHALQNPSSDTCDPFVCPYAPQH
jgi:hypothetical protein